MSRFNLKRRFREWQLKKGLARAVRLLRKMDTNMRDMGWPRQRRRGFWRDFSRSPSLRGEVFKEIIGTMEEK